MDIRIIQSSPGNSNKQQSLGTFALEKRHSPHASETYQVSITNDYLVASQPVLETY